MKPGFFLKGWLLLAAALNVAGCINPGLKNAKAGLIACVYPDFVRRRCNYIEWFEIKDNDAVVVIAREMSWTPGRAVMQMSYRAVIKDGAICGQWTEDDVEQATFTIEGNPASNSETAEAVRSDMIRDLRTDIREDLCHTFILEEGKWLVGSSGWGRVESLQSGGTGNEPGRVYYRDSKGQPTPFWVTLPMIWLPKDHVFTLGRLVLAAPDPNPGFENAKAGLIACVRPDNERRRCDSAAWFEISNDDSVVVFHNGFFPMFGTQTTVEQFSYRAVVKGGAICGQPTEDDVLHATFSTNRNPASDSETETYRAALAKAWQGEVCLTFVLHGDGLRFYPTDGTGRPRADLDDEPMIWLPKDHMFAVGQ